MVGKTTTHGCFKMDLVKKSEYILQLSSVSRQRYIEKLTKVGLSNDPYCLESPEWEKDPENLPSLSWSDIANAVHGIYS